QTPLSLAAEGGHEAVVKLLFETGKVDVNSRNIRSQTPLWLAAQGGHEAVVKLLFKTGKVDINSKEGKIGRKLLLLAAEERYKAIA
ncbi:ankyrin repeat-containing domain protein, partial [Cenococcum geophilum]